MSSLNKSDDFAERVNYAVRFITEGRASSRDFDNCFENDDGDAVAAALVRRSQSNERLRVNLFKYINEQMAIEACDRFTGRNLPEVARELRAAAQATRKVPA